MRKYVDYINEQRQTENSEQRHFEELRYKRYKLKQQRKLTGIIFFLTGVISYFLIKYLFELPNVYSILIGLLFSTLGLGLYLINYLQTDIYINDEKLPGFSNNILVELDELRFEFQKFKKKAGIIEDSEQLNQLINNIINGTLNKEFIQNKIESTFSNNALNSYRHDNLFSEFEKTAYRINEELIRLRKSANINLVIGSLSTTIAIFALTYEVFFSEVNFKVTVDLLSHYIPRISLVIFIEIFAFFFLKLYKSTLLEIKYFNNEKTNIDFKLISLKTALFQDDKKMIKLCLIELIKTERNFILKKEDTTVELEKFKADKNDNQILASLLEKLLAKK
ncbi:hypothetical protein [Flavobacterium granuli]|uniref:Uncharacterized protein n=1 Tax=Flavobacterium granuli TaxID=280093 RepID=A0A1M5NHC1_9FLAO|nr:hypothetical protein [Flavobacterium granuli]PRZ23283.1 hypothetical protein BC624_1055 [Flavobacterium granuli]SHG88964.1 hypothetical protein SAMN05443373_1055 [Flavobacterium granuli]